MGAITFSLDLGLVKALRKVMPIEIFVETGTFTGDTIELVKNHFQKIYTVELSPSYYEAALVRFQSHHNVTAKHGDSADVLTNLQQALRNTSVLYYLDAHWCMAEDVAGGISQCPLIRELRAIESLNIGSVIIIDDARLFLAAPSAPNEISQWPTFDEVLLALRTISEHHKVMILNDVIIFFPPPAEIELTKYAQDHGTNWLDAINKARDYDSLASEVHNIQHSRSWRMTAPLRSCYRKVQHVTGKWNNLKK